MIKKYIKFLTKASNQHGVHSPFVYKLITECLYAKPSKIIKSAYLKNLKTVLNKEVQIANLDKNKPKYNLFLNRLVSYLGMQTILEIQPNLGISSWSLCCENVNIKIDSIETDKHVLEIVEKLYKEQNIDQQLITHQGEISRILPDLVSQKKYDLIYFKGDYTKENLLNYFKTCLTSIHNDSVFIIENMYESVEMEEVWAQIKAHSLVTVTVDLYKQGLVFFRREQEKEHFKIRF